MSESQEELQLPPWSADCGRDATLVAWAILQAASQIYTLANAVLDVEDRLRRIEQSLDDELPNAGRGK